MNKELYAQYIKNNLSQDAAWEAFVDGLNILSEEEIKTIIKDRQSAIDKYFLGDESPDTTVKVKTMEDSDFPKWKGLDWCPLVIEYVGDWPKFTKDTAIIFIDDSSFIEKLLPVIRKYDAILCTVINREDNLTSLTFYTPHLEKAAEGLPYVVADECHMFCREEDAITIGYALCSGCVAAIGSYEQGFKVRAPYRYAIPGRCGCITNRLIKNGWHLCDSVRDVQEMIEAIIGNKDIVDWSE